MNNDCITKECETSVASLESSPRSADRWRAYEPAEHWASVIKSCASLSSFVQTSHSKKSVFYLNGFLVLYLTMSVLDPKRNILTGSDGDSLITLHPMTHRDIAAKETLFSELGTCDYWYCFPKQNCQIVCVCVCVCVCMCVCKLCSFSRDEM